MNAYYKGQLIFGLRGPVGPDGNPIGTIISYMGLTAPKDYLICDGAAYNISDYPELAAFFAEQFGSANHFGGDGETTFAVPDMRNLFLRGYHGEAEEQLSGDIGEKQEATKIPYISSDNNLVGPLWSSPQNVDSVSSETTEQYGYSEKRAGGGDRHMAYTSRPVNMAVLFCIKAVESVKKSGLEEYDTEDGWHVRKWSDGYVEMVLKREVNIPSFAGTSTGSRFGSLCNATEFPISLVEKYSEVISILKNTASGDLWPGVKNTNLDILHNTNTYSAYTSSTSVNKAVGVVISISITGIWK